MKVLIISDSPRANTGYGKLVKAWGSHLVAKGHEVLVMGGVSPNAQVPFEPEEFEGMTLWTVPGYGNAEHVRYFLKKHSPDVIIANADPRFFGFLFKMDNEVRQKCPLVFYHLWDDFPFPDFNIPSYLSCDSIFCGSKFTYDLLTENLPSLLPSYELTQTPADTSMKFLAGGVKYIPIGINEKVFYPLSPEANQDFDKEVVAFTHNRYPGIDFMVGFVGRHSERKNVLGVIKSFAEWSRDKSDAALFIHSPIVDSGHALAYAIQTEYPDAKIIYSSGMPHMYPDELINKFYNHFDILVNRSSAEGFGLPICEAMAAGVPCIAVDNAGPRELVTDETGWLLEADCTPLFGNAEVPFIQMRHVTDQKFIAALDDAYYNRERRREKASKCREHILSHYTEDKMCAALEQGLKEVISAWTPYPEHSIFSWPVLNSPNQIASSKV